MDMSCISDSTIGKIAELMDATELEAVRDKKDKLISRIFLKKMNQLMSHVGFPAEHANMRSQGLKLSLACVP